MAYTFLQDLGDVKAFYGNGRDHFNSLAGQVTRLPIETALQDQVVQQVSQRSASFGCLLRRAIPVMLCSAWESFVDELKVTDITRYQTHFVMYGLWHSEPVREIALIRHCITHSKNKIDAEYLRKSKLKTFNTLGTLIDFSDPDLDLQFKTFEDAYNNITS